MLLEALNTAKLSPGEQTVENDEGGGRKAGIQDRKEAEEQRSQALCEKKDQIEKHRV